MQFRDPTSFPAYVTKSAEWHAIRAKHVGASEIAALFGVQAAYQNSAFALHHIKAGAEPPKVEGERVDWGLRLEHIMAEAAAEQEGWQIIKGGYAEDEHCPGLGASLDHIILAPSAEDAALGCVGPGVLEAKNVDWMIHRASWSNDEPPIHIALQLQAQLACTGYQWGAVVALVGGNHIEVYRFFARPALIDSIRERVFAFWDRIAKGEPPPVDGSDSATDILRQLYPEVVDDAIDMSANNEFSEACADFLTFQKAKKAAIEGCDTSRNRLEDLLRGHKRGYGGGYSVSVSVTPEKPPRRAREGEIIPGRAEARRFTVKAA